MNRLFIYLFCLQLFACKKKEEIVDTKEKNNILKIIEAESKTQNLNSVSYCVVKNDSLLWANAIGFANQEDEVKATPATRYLIASISKSVTAVAAMQLYEQNKLNLDADINTYLPFIVKHPKFPNTNITTRMLLNHSSSISDLYSNQYNAYCWGDDCTTPLKQFLEDILVSGKQKYSDQSFYDYAPGDKANYSNVAYALLGYLVEVVSKQPFDNYCQQNIFLPLGMTKTEWRIKNTPLAEWAIPYGPTNNSGTPYYSFPDYPNGGLKTTVTDLSKFLRMLIMRGSFMGQQIVLPSTIALMEIPTFTFERGGGNLNFGLGMYYFDFKGKELYGHGGGEQGVTTAMHYDKQTKVGVIVFSNTSSANLNLMVYSLYQYGIQQ